MPETKFHVFRLKPFILEALQDIGFHEPTEIQKKLIPVALKRKSVIGQSQTGTGKTHSYLLPILHLIDPSEEKVQAVILAPTRELAGQIHEEILKITKFCPPGEEIRSRLFTGGMDKKRDMEKLKRQPHIVVGTPGRINDLAKEQALFVHTADILVVDEADLALEMGFIVDVDQVAARMPEKLQMLVFSATIPEKLKPFLRKYMENPEHIHIHPKQAAAENIVHYLLPARHRSKPDLVCDLLTALNPYLAICFANTKDQTEELADELSRKGLKVAVIHGGLSPRQRRKVMKQIRDLEFQYIVATDLAARGIDIEGVSHVINYELPADLDFYVHRAGRTGRAGMPGTAVTIYERSDEDAVNRLEKRGISFVHVDIKKGQLVEIEPRSKRKKRPQENSEIDAIARALLKKPKKVKPGYKKKLKKEIEMMKRRAKRFK